MLAGVCLAAGLTPLALAQGRGGGGPPGGGGGGMNGGPGGPGGGGQNGGPGGGQLPGNNGGGPGGAPPPPPGQGGQSSTSTMHGGLQLGPPGKWWDDKSFAKSLKLRPDQQMHMDAIFSQNRNALLSHYEGLQAAETQMGELTKAPTLDEAALFAQIDRVAQARADLEKAETHYLLQIRKEMDADQIARLEKHR